MISHDQDLLSTIPRSQIGNTLNTADESRNSDFPLAEQLKDLSAYEISRQGFAILEIIFNCPFAKVLISRSSDLAGLKLQET